MLDLIVVGAGPTGIAIGAEARRANLDFLLVDRGPLVANLLEFPTYMTFFTTRDLLEVADTPFSIPQDKPDRRQAISYYQGIARKFALPIASHEEIQSVKQTGNGFEVLSLNNGHDVSRKTRAVALATGYFHRPNHLEVPGESGSWVHHRYLEPYGHFGESVVVVGGGNSALEAALDLWRNGCRVTVVHRGDTVKDSVKYWVKPDFLHRVEEGSIRACFSAEVEEFGDQVVKIQGASGSEAIVAEVAYVLIGYLPDTDLQLRCGIEVDTRSLVPKFNPNTCESNIPGLYVAGTLQAGRDTGKIFIENSRVHGARIVKHLSRSLG